MWRGLFVVWLGVFSCLGLADDKIEFKRKGAVVKTYTLEELKKALPPVTVKVNEGHENKEVTYHGFDFKALMEKVYGPGFQKEVDEALFVCSDGYQPSVPLLKALKHKSVLAYEKAGGVPFSFEDKEEKRTINYGPLYLVWENIDDKLLASEGLEFWPYQVVTVDLIAFEDRFKKLVPKGKMSEAAKRGFVSYRVHCLQCHRINGEGGNKGIELNYPASVTEYFKEPWIKKFITDPRTVRAGSPMPPFDTRYPNYKGIIDDIVEYLKAVAKNKQG